MRSVSLSLARWTIMALFLAMLAVTVAGAIRFPAYLSSHIQEFNSSDSWTFAQTQVGLEQLGWPPDTLGWVAFLRDTIGFGLPFIVLFLLIWSRANNWYLMLIAFVFALYGGGAAGVPTLVIGESVPLVATWNDLFGGLSWQLFFLLFFFFPSGRPVPHWSRWIAGAWGVLMFVQLLSPTARSADSPLITIVSIAFVLSAIGSQIYRYARRSTANERQQTKWVVYVLGITAVYVAIVAPSQFRAPAGPDYGRALLLSLANLLIFGLMFQLVPIVIALSILRYRLWDIDLVIRRTLVYAVVTGLLALVFYGSVILFQRMFTGISGQQSTVALVASTLAIAALFSPLRRRVQGFVDRRFYRRKYDAQEVLSQFSMVARDETDLEKLAGGLAAAVSETVQPAQLALWIKRS